MFGSCGQCWEENQKKNPILNYKPSWAVKKVKISFWTKGEHAVSPQCDISLSLTECRLSISLKQLISGIFRPWLCSCLLFPFSHPVTPCSIILFSQYPFIQTLVKCFPIWSFPLLFVSYSPSNNFFYHITVWYALWFDSFFFLLLTWYLVGCCLDFLGMNSSPGCG